ncbi:MAG: cupin domain-containing protein [Solirubrobacteraceae bacterium]
MPPQAPLEPTPEGLVPVGDGWFVVNARDARWHHVEGRTAYVDFEGESGFAQLGINLSVLEPGEAMARYHWEKDQEDFLVLAGEPVLVIEGEERPLRQWDFVHCPPGTAHVIVGAGRSPSIVLAVGARAHASHADSGAYPFDAVAARHEASVEHETADAHQAYDGLTRRQPTAYRAGWLL